MVTIGIDCRNGSESQVLGFSLDTNPDLTYSLLLNGQSTMNNYGISYDRSMVIDQDGVIQYSDYSVILADIQQTIDDLLTTDIKNDNFDQISFQLFDNYPNPFNPETTIRFTVNQSQKINLNIFDAQGRLISRLVNREMQPGEYSIKWNGTDKNNQRVATSIYFYQLEGDNQVIVKKMQFLK